MIREKHNLRCTKGHLHYSPTPAYWAGMACGRPVSQPGETKTKRCDAPMRKLKK